MPIGLSLSLSGSVPIALLPVRLETRFTTSPAGEHFLLIRVYVDDIHRDTHEPTLTADEVVWGRVFWQDTWRAGLADPAKADYPTRLAQQLTQEQAAWKQLASRFGAARSVHVAQRLTPTNRSDRPVVLNLNGSLAAEPQLPSPGEPRKSSWERAAQARCLPDNWLAIAYAGAQILTERGKPVPRDLAVGPDPSAAAPPLPPPPTSFPPPPVDPGMLWMVDFDEAILKGMAIRMKLEPDVAKAGLDRLVVIGVRASGATPEAGSEELQGLFDAHRYTWGLSLLPHGTPTNNTDSVRSGYSREDTGFQASFALRNQGVPRREDAGGKVAQALGSAASNFQGLAMATDPAPAGVEDINRALWPTTLGYFVEQFFNGVFPSYDADAWCNYFSRFVRAAGPVPGIRAGRQPYSILPATTLEGWNATALPPMLPFLKSIRDAWQASVPTIPHAGRNPADTGRDLVEVLGQQPGSQAYAWRWARGADFIRNFWRLPGQQVDSGLLEANIAAATEQVKKMLLKIGLEPAVMPRIAAMTFSGEHEIYDAPTVQDPALPTDVALKSNYIARLANAAVSMADLHTESAALWPDETAPKPLLYRLLRHATLLAYAHQALEDWLLEVPLLGLATRGSSPPWFDPELIDALADPPANSDVSLTAFKTQTFSRVLLEAMRPDPRQPGTTISRGEFLRQTAAAGSGTPLARFLASLQNLSSLPVATLDTLLRDSLDLVSYRLDAWVTSVASFQLDRCRTQGGARGIFIGGYGWVEDLRPRQALAMSDGFIHAPTTAHANAAAILRSGYLAHKDQADGARLQVDLSSRRVRQALALVDGVRQGQPLGALLGYQLERRLHDHVPRLDACIQPLRQLAPLLGAGKVPRATGEPLDTVAANNVVDGAALLKLFEADPNLFAPFDLAPFDQNRAALEAEVRALQDAVNALGDLSLAEGVYQAVQGNYGRASANLDALSRGDAPTDFEVLKTPRSGTGFTQRLVVLLNAAASDSNGWSNSTPRAVAALPLAAWAGYLLGPPKRVKFTVAYFKAGTDPKKSQPVSEKTFSLADLSPLPSALDIVYAPPVSDQPAQTELELRLIKLAVEKRDKATVSVDAVLQLRFARVSFGGSETDVTLSELFELARPVRELITNSRPLDARDLAQAGSIDGANIMLDAFRDDYGTLLVRWDLAQKGLVASIRDVEDGTATDLQKLRDAMETLSGFAVQHAVPTAVSTSTDADRADLLDQAGKVSAQVAALSKQLPSALNTTLDAPTVIAAIGVLLGQGFRLTPAFRLDGASTYPTATAKRSAADDAGPARTLEWLRTASTVRDQVRRMRSVQMLGETVSDPPHAISLQVAQLPLSDDPWNALGSASRVGATSIVAGLAFSGSGPTAPPGVIAGLLVDEWVEVLPRQTIDTGLAVHHDAPGATAPQAILLAVAPDLAADWSEATLAAIVGETLDLAKLRMLDVDLLPGMGQFLPAIYLAGSIGGVPGGDTVSTRFN